MKKFLIIIGALLSLTACTGDKTTVITNEDRVFDLERRMALNEQLDAAQSDLIALNASAISALDGRVTSLESSVSQLQSDLAAAVTAQQAGDAALSDLIAQEAAAREAGDQAQADALASAISAQQANNAAQAAAIVSLQIQLAGQSVINLLVQGQLAAINAKFPTINSKLTSLQTQINNTNIAVDALQSQVGDLQADLSSLDLRMNAAEGDLSDLQDQIDALTARLDAEGVKVYKCNMPSSEERFFKINGKLYGAMNKVTTGTSSVVTAGTPVSVSIPKLCKNNGDQLKLADSNGNCNDGGWSAVSGTGVTTTVPAYSSANVTVVTSVQISLEQLLPGTNYVTTDGTAPCTFNGDGTNLVPFN